MIGKSERLTILSDAEQEALYGLPDFDDAQRLEYLALTETELALASSRPGLHAQVYCVLQIGYFKAKRAFFRFDWSEVEDDCAFVLSRYFHGEPFERKAITKHERYTQRERVAELFGYRPWAADFLPQLAQQARQTGDAAIVCVNSLLAAQPEPHMVATSAARAGLKNLVRSLATEFAPQHVRVNGILVGLIESGQWRRRFEAREDKSQDWAAWTGALAQRKHIPLGRLGIPQEAAQAIFYLASPLSSYTTGSHIDVSGGLSHHA